MNPVILYVALLSLISAYVIYNYFRKPTAKDLYLKAIKNDPNPKATIYRHIQQKKQQAIHLLSRG